MKKTRLLLSVLLCIGTLTSCARNSAQPSSSPSPSPSDPFDAGGISYIRNPSVFEYGDPYTIINNNPPFYAYIRYPQADDFADNTILEWANKIYNDATAEVSRLRNEENPNAEGEVNIQFDSYLVDGRFAGIVEKGMFMTSIMANPAEIVKIFNLDLEHSIILQNSDILDPAKNTEVLALLKGKIFSDIPEDITTTLGGVNETLLENIVINHSGIDVVVARGTYLPNYLGTRTYTLTYEELGSAFRLGQTNTTAAPPSAEQAEPPSDIPPEPETPSIPPPGRTIDPLKPMLALTFDDGPSKYTNQLLDMVEKYDARVTFCVVGNAIGHRSDVVARAYNMGNEIIGHTWDHLNLTKLTTDQIRDEILSTNKAIEAAAGAAPKLFRPPYGAVNADVKNISAELGYSMIYWSVDTLDWKTKNANAVYNAIMKDAKDRAIILCHDLHGTTVEAMERVIPALIEQGYQLVTVSELMEYSNIEFEPGEVYYKGK